MSLALACVLFHASAYGSYLGDISNPIRLQDNIYDTWGFESTTTGGSSLGVCALPWQKAGLQECPYGTRLPGDITWPWSGVPRLPANVTLPGMDSQRRDSLFFLYLSVVYSIVPYVFALSMFLKFLTRRGTRELHFVLFLGFIVLCNEVFVKPFVRFPRPPMSCLYTCGMPSSHAAISVGTVTLYMVHNIRRCAPVQLAILDKLQGETKNQRATKWKLFSRAFRRYVPFYSGKDMSFDESSPSDLMFTGCTWLVFLLPVPLCRIALDDHSAGQVFVGGGVGALAALIYGWLAQKSLKRFNKHLGRVWEIRGTMVLHHNMPLPCYEALESILNNVIVIDDEVPFSDKWDEVFKVKINSVMERVPRDRVVVTSCNSRVLNLQWNDHGSPEFRSTPSKDFFPLRIKARERLENIRQLKWYERETVQYFSRLRQNESLDVDFNHYLKFRWVHLRRLLDMDDDTKTQATALIADRLDQADSPTAASGLPGASNDLEVARPSEGSDQGGYWDVGLRYCFDMDLDAKALHKDWLSLKFRLPDANSAAQDDSCARVSTSGSLAEVQFEDGKSSPGLVFSFEAAKEEVKRLKRELELKEADLKTITGQHERDKENLKSKESKLSSVETELRRLEEIVKEKDDASVIYQKRLDSEERKSKQLQQRNDELTEDLKLARQGVSSAVEQLQRERDEAILQRDQLVSEQCEKDVQKEEEFDSRIRNVRHVALIERNCLDERHKNEIKNLQGELDAQQLQCNRMLDRAVHAETALKTSHDSYQLLVSKLEETLRQQRAIANETQSQQHNSEKKHPANSQQSFYSILPDVALNNAVAGMWGSNKKPSIKIQVKYRTGDTYDVTVFDNRDQIQTCSMRAIFTSATAANVTLHNWKLENWNSSIGILNITPLDTTIQWGVGAAWKVLKK